MSIHLSMERVRGAAIRLRVLRRSVSSHRHHCGDRRVGVGRGLFPICGKAGRLETAFTARFEHLREGFKCGFSQMGCLWLPVVA